MSSEWCVFSKDRESGEPVGMPFMPRGVLFMLLWHIRIYAKDDMVEHKAWNCISAPSLSTAGRGKEGEGENSAYICT